MTDRIMGHDEAVALLELREREVALLRHELALAEHERDALIEVVKGCECNCVDSHKAIWS